MTVGDGGSAVGSVKGSEKGTSHESGRGSG